MAAMAGMAGAAGAAIGIAVHPMHWAGLAAGVAVEDLQVKHCVEELSMRGVENWHVGTKTHPVAKMRSKKELQKAVRHWAASPCIASCGLVVPCPDRVDDLRWSLRINPANEPTFTKRFSDLMGYPPTQQNLLDHDIPPRGAYARAAPQLFFCQYLACAKSRA